MSRQPIQGRGPIRPLQWDTQPSNVETMNLEPTGAQHQNLLRWYEVAKDRGQMHDLHSPDFHRLQIERWIHDRAQVIMGPASGAGVTDITAARRALDFGVIQRRAWQDDRYATAGVSGQEDVAIDLCASIPVEHPCFAACDVVICSEVLEHVQRPFDACDTLWYCLKPGGTLIITSPFLWPDHATPTYPDYWRFTEGAWRMLMASAGFEIVTIKPTAWTHNGKVLYDLLRSHEGWGFPSMVEGFTSYMVEAVKPLDAKPGRK